jgi:hypothetical protein
MMKPSAPGPEHGTTAADAADGAEVPAQPVLTEGMPAADKNPGHGAEQPEEERFQQQEAQQQTQQHAQHERPHEHLLKCARAVEEQLVLAGERQPWGFIFVLCSLPRKTAPARLSCDHFFFFF